MTYRMPGARLKFGNKPTTIDGIRFDSMGEAARYKQLLLLQHAKLIHGLKVHPAYPLVVNGVKIGVYEADFSYQEDDKDVVEDFKSPVTKTATYNIKKKLMKALYGVEIKEVMR